MVSLSRKSRVRTRGGRQEVAAKISKSPPRLADDKKTVVGGGNLELGDDGGVMQFYLLNINAECWVHLPGGGITWNLAHRVFTPSCHSNVQPQSKLIFSDLSVLAVTLKFDLQHYVYT